MLISSMFFEELSYVFCDRTQAVLIEFTQYHKQTGILAPVSVLLDQTHTGRILAFISIQPFHISPLSGPDLHVTLTVLALLQDLFTIETNLAV